MTTISQSTRSWLTKQLGTAFEIEKHSYSHQDDVYKIQTSSANVYLKVSSTLTAERDNLRIVQSLLSVPEVIGFTRIEDKDHLLLREIPGKNLAERIGEWDTTTIVHEFAMALRQFHALDVQAVFPHNTLAGVVLHGDMALPNIISEKPGSMSYIDLAQMAVGTPDIDLADALWSLQRNLGPGYGELFLKEYGPFKMTERVEKALAFRYVAEAA